MKTRNARSTPNDGSATTIGKTFLSLSMILRSLPEFFSCCDKSYVPRSATPWSSFQPNGNLYSRSQVSVE